jgi:hypothetical protein
MINIDDYVIHTKRKSHGHTNNQVVFKFPNGYGASLIQGRYSYGGDLNLFEVAVVQFVGTVWVICYDTEITDDVLGYLTEEEVFEALEKIYNLTGLTDENKQSRIGQDT